MTEWAALFDGQLGLSPAPLDEALGKLPARRGLALLVAEGERPVLLLPAADLRARVAGRLKNPDEQERRRMPDLAAITRKVLWRLAGSHFECDLRFLEISRKLWPDSYAELLAWRPAWFIGVDLRADYPHFARTQEVLRRGEGVSPSRIAGILPASVSSASSVPSSSSSSSSSQSSVLPSDPVADCTGGTPMLRQRFFGPFPSGLAAQRFIEALADGFLLCRDARCLRQAPHGRRCSYGQMGKCLCACDGSISSADYRAVVARAADFVAGDRRPAIAALQQEMRQAAADLQFERAAALKARLARMGDLNGPDFAYVAPAEEFRFLLVQRGPKRRKLAAFLADTASIRSAGEVDYPPKAEQLQKLVGRACLPDKHVHDLPGKQRRASMPALLGGEPAVASPSDATHGTLKPPRFADKWAMGLVAHYLFAGPRRRGLILPVRADLTAEALAQEIEKSAESLGIKKPAAGPEPDV